MTLYFQSLFRVSEQNNIFKDSFLGQIVVHLVWLALREEPVWAEAKACKSQLIIGAFTVTEVPYHVVSRKLVENACV